MNNNFTLSSITPDPFKFESTYPTYEGKEMNMPTKQMTEEEFDLNLLNQNLAARFAIQQKCPPTIKIIDFDVDSNKWEETCETCHKAAVTSKGDLIELMFELKECGEYSNGIYPDYYWIAELVSSKEWTDDIHKHYFENYHNYDLYDLEPNEFGSNVHACYTEFYPID